MEQKDYLLREIEKIGLILRAIRQLIFGSNGNTEIILEQQIAQTKEKLFNEMNFNLDDFLSLNTEKSDEYIENFAGFNVENMELLAECLFQIGFNGKEETAKKYLEKALQLYQLCNHKSKTYSFERQTTINEIKNRL